MVAEQDLKTRMQGEGGGLGEAKPVEVGSEERTGCRETAFRAQRKVSKAEVEAPISPVKLELASKIVTLTYPLHPFSGLHFQLGCQPLA